MQLKKSLKSGLTIDRHKFTSLRNKATKCLRKAKAKFYIYIINDSKGNCKKIWENLNKLAGRHKKELNHNVELKINNIIISNPSELTNEFNIFFSNSVREITAIYPPPEIVTRPIDPLLPVFHLREITELEVNNIIGSLKNSKAKDVQGLDTYYLKMFKDALIAPITHLINSSFKHKVAPSSWKVASVTPIFKSGDEISRPIVRLVFSQWSLRLLRSGL